MPTRTDCTRPASSASLRAMTQLVLTAIGDDREGLVSALAEQVDRHGGNWLESGLAHLAGKFAGVVLIDVPEDSAAQLTEALAALEGTVGLRVEVTDARRAAATAADRADGAGGPSTSLRLSLVGQDRTGMVREITTALAEQGASIEDLRTRTSAAPEGGGMLFEAEALVHLPSSLDPAQVREALETIAAELMVDLDLDDPA